MATSNKSRGWYLMQTDSNVTHGVNQYCVDSVADIAYIPINSCQPGSSVIDISTGDVYMLNSERQWKKI